MERFTSVASFSATVLSIYLSIYQPLPHQGQVLCEVVPLQLVMVPLLADGVHLASQLLQLLLEDLSGPVGLAMLLLALELVELLLQCTILLLKIAHLLDEAGKTVVELLELGLFIASGGQELLVDGFSQGEVHLGIGEARCLGAGAGTLLVVAGGAGGRHRCS